MAAGTTDCPGVEEQQSRPALLFVVRTGPVVRVEHHVVDPEPAQVARRRQARLAGRQPRAVSG